MAVVPAALGALVLSNVDTRFAAVRGWHPLQQRNPSYYILFANAIGKGILTAGPVINFQTQDTGNQGSPFVTGTGAGIGIVVDPNFIVPDLYERARAYIQAEFGRTLHDPYPPRRYNSGEFLLALCLGINDAIMQYYPTTWILSSTHPQIYQGTGVVPYGNFSGLSAPAIAASILSFAPNFVGRFWPKLAQAISESYVELIHNHSTGTVTITGNCVSSISQSCGIGGTGIGTGTAT